MRDFIAQRPLERLVRRIDGGLPISTILGITSPDAVGGKRLRRNAPRCIPERIKSGFQCSMVISDFAVFIDDTFRQEHDISFDDRFRVIENAVVHFVGCVLYSF